MARRTAHNKLKALVERDELRTRKVGARGRVWWVPHWRGDDHTDRASDDRPADADEGERKPSSTAEGASGDASPVDTNARSDAPPETSQTSESNEDDTARATSSEDGQ